MNNEVAFGVGMILRVVKAEVEKFRGRRPPIQIITLSCSYAEVLSAVGLSHGKLTVRILRPHPFDTSGDLARVHPISAPAMVSIPLPERPLPVDTELALDRRDEQALP